MGDVSGAGYSPSLGEGLGVGNSSGGYAIRLNKGAGGGNQVAYAMKTIMALIHMSAITKSNLNIKLKLLKHFL